MTLKKSWTDAQIKALKPEAKRYEKYIVNGGLGLRVSPAGVKTWIYRYKINGKTERLTIGHYPTMGLNSANMRFLELSHQRRDGLNPKVLIQEQKALKEQQRNNTVKKLILEWYTGYVEKNRKRPDTIQKQINLDIIPLLGDKELDKLQTIDIANALDSIVKRGAPIHANRVLSSIKQAFNYALSRGRIQHNPAIGIKSRDIGGQEKSRERVLSLNEIKALWQFLDSNKSQMTIQTKYAIKILLLTGVRTSELRLATFKEINFDEDLWTIPGAHTKTGITMKIHLSPQVKALFMRLKNLNQSGYVLSGIKPNTPLTENALPRAIKRIEPRLGISNWTAHDLRRTFATQLGEALLIDPVVIEKCLGHKMPRIMATYNKNEMLPQRKDTLNRWAQFIENLLQENVVPLSLKMSGRQAIPN